MSKKTILLAIVALYVVAVSLVLVRAEPREPLQRGDLAIERAMR